jgi:hypothetical protein
MRLSLVVVTLLCLVLAMTLAACGRQAAPGDAGPPPPPPPPPAPGPAAEAPAAPATPAAEAPKPEAVLAEVGAPLYEGAEADKAEVKDGKTMATYLTSASYKDVKAFYMEKLKAPDWTNNGLEMGAMGGDEWEFKSADETKFVLVKKDTDNPKTQIRFTLKPKQ